MTEHDHHGDGNLAHHFDTPMQQYDSGKLGMWVFLVTEILLFGGLFCAYSVYRANHPEIFLYAHHFLDKWLGGLNTVVLICSSLTMAWAVRAAQMGNNKLLVRLLSVTVLFAFCFLGVKFIEYRQKWEHGLLWGKHYRSPSAHEETDRAEAEGEEHAAGGESETGHGEEPKNVHIFFGIYFIMTGLHGVHVIAGIAMLIWLIVRARKGHFSEKNFAAVDNGGLYWHLVDVIWIFLFPLLYLIA